MKLLNKCLLALVKDWPTTASAFILTKPIMKLLNSFGFSALCCLSIVACEAGNCLKRNAPIVHEGDGFHIIIDEQDPVNRLWDAARKDDTPALEQAINDGANSDDDLRIAFHEAFDRCCLAVVKYLFIGFPEVMQRLNINSDYLVQWAAHLGHVPIVRFFLIEFSEGQQANIHADNDKALRLAANANRWAMVAYLLQQGADRTVLTVDQQTHFLQKYILRELEAAPSKNDWPMVEELLNILPMLQVPENIQEQISRIVVPAVANKFVDLRISLFNLQQLPSVIQERILISTVGASAYRYFINRYHRARSEQGVSHETAE